MADPQVKLPSEYEDATPISVRLPQGFEDARPSSLSPISPPGMPKPVYDPTSARNPLQGVAGYDAFGPIKDTLYTRVGQRIQQNLDLPRQVGTAADAISSGIRRIKEGGLREASRLEPSTDSQRTAFLEGLKQYKEPSNVLGDLATAYITGEGGSGPEGLLSHGDIVDQHIPNGADNLRVKSEIDFHLQRGDIAGAESALDRAAGKANPEYKPPSARGTKGISDEDLNAIREGGAETRRSSAQFVQDVINRKGLPTDPSMIAAEAAQRGRALEMQQKYPVPRWQRIQDPFAAPSPERMRIDDFMRKELAKPDIGIEPEPEALPDEDLEPLLKKSLEQYQKHGKFLPELEARRLFIARNGVNA